MRVPVAVFAILAPATTLACRYNVRDTGFVAPEAAGPTLHLLVADAEATSGSSALVEAATAALVDTGIRLVVHRHPERAESATSDGSGPEEDRPEGWNPARLPAALLVLPDGRRLDLPLPGGPRPPAGTGRSPLEIVGRSPLRSRLAASCVDRWAAVVLLASGRDDVDRTARAVVEAAVRKAAAGMASLPKAIEGEPELIVVSPSEQREDPVLLWALGLPSSGATHPAVAVVYGRLRSMGPVVQGDAIDEREIEWRLATIGADCECGLDRRLLAGTALPIAWGPALRSRAASRLGFDPDHPRVRAEIRRILWRASSRSAPAEGSALDRSAPALGYQELAVGGAGALPATGAEVDGDGDVDALLEEVDALLASGRGSSPDAPSSAPAAEARSPRPVRTPAADRRRADGSSRESWRGRSPPWLVATGCLVALLALGGAAAVWIASRRRDR